MAGGAARKLGALRNEGEADGLVNGRRPSAGLADGERMLGAGANEGELRGGGEERGAGAGAGRCGEGVVVRGATGAALRGATGTGAARAGVAVRDAAGSSVRGAAAEGVGDAAPGAGTERAMLRGRTSGRGSAPAALGVCVLPSERVV